MQALPTGDAWAEMVESLAVKRRACLPKPRKPKPTAAERRAQDALVSARKRAGQIRRRERERDTGYFGQQRRSA